MAHQPLAGDARARRDDVDRGPVLRPDPRRARRGRDQGRAPRHGRRRPRLGPAVLERRGHDVPLGERGQALARDLAPRPARPRGAAPARRRRRRVPAEPPPRSRRASSGSAPTTLRARNPRLVYCSVGAYGHVGPLAHEPGYDALMQAAGGLISITGEPGRPGVRVGSSLIDQGTGTWAAVGVLAALLERERDGRGLGRRRLPLRDGDRLHRLPPRRLPRGRHRPARPGNALPDGGAVPGVRDARRRADDRRRQRPAVRRDLRRRSGCPELVDDPRFATNPDRVRHRDELFALLEARLAHGRHGDLARAAHARRASRPPLSRTSRDVAKSPQTEALGMMQPLDAPPDRGPQLTALPLSFDGERMRSHRARRRTSASTPPSPPRGGLRATTRSRRSPQRE